jgi:hypothetical protein
MKEWAPKQVEYFSQKYKTAENGNYDIYVVFVEKAMYLLDTNGLFGFILPNKFFQAEYGKNLRELLTKNNYLREIVNFGDEQVFDEVTTYTNLLFLSKTNKKAFKYAEVKKLENPSSQMSLIAKNVEYKSPLLNVGMLPTESVSEKPWQFSFGAESKLLQKMSMIQPTLSTVCDKIFQGIITGADDIFVLELKSDSGIDSLELFSKTLEHNVTIERKLLKPLLKGSLDIRRYRIVTPKKYVIFPYYIDGNSVSLIPFNDLKSKFPNCARYLEENRKALEERERGKWKCLQWYGFSRNQNLVQCSKEKILTPSIAKKAAFVYDSDGKYYFLGSGGGGGGGYGLSLDSRSNIDPYYLIGLLNSKLLDYLTKKNSSHFSGGFYAYNKQYIESLPIIDPKTEQQLALKKQIIELCKRILERNKTIAITTDSTRVELLEREAIVYEEKIDQLVYQLYDITSEERKLIEEVNPD